MAKSKNKNQSDIFIYGKHALNEALTGLPYSLKRVWLDPKLLESALVEKLRSHNIKVDQLKAGQKSGADHLAHQGVIARVDPDHLLQPFKDHLSSLEITKDTAFLLLDELQDPQNVGAVIRSAAAFGFSGILVPKHHQVPITGAVVKASAGLAFRIPLLQIGNVNQALTLLKNNGFWIYGLTGSGDHDLSQADFSRPSVLVIGNEAQGIRAKTLEYCDVKLTIPIHARAESLNVSAAAAVACYSWSLQHAEMIVNRSTQPLSGTSLRI